MDDGLIPYLKWSFELKILAYSASFDLFLVSDGVESKLTTVSIFTELDILNNTKI